MRRSVIKPNRAASVALSFIEAYHCTIEIKITRYTATHVSSDGKRPPNTKGGIMATEFTSPAIGLLGVIIGIVVTKSLDFIQMHSEHKHTFARIRYENKVNILSSGGPMG